MNTQKFGVQSMPFDVNLTKGGANYEENISA